MTVKTASQKARDNVKVKPFTQKELTVSVLAIEESIKKVGGQISAFSEGLPTLIKNGVKDSLNDGGGTIVRGIIKEETHGKTFVRLRQWAMPSLTMFVVADNMPGFSWEDAITAVIRTIATVVVGG